MGRIFEKLSTFSSHETKTARIPPVFIAIMVGFWNDKEKDKQTRLL
jgi:hypothetical protein